MVKKTVKKLMNLPPVSFVSDVVKIYFEKRVGRAAAQLAYFMVLSFFPILICLVSFVARWNLNIRVLLEQARQFLPTGVYRLMQEYLGYVDGNISTPMLITGIVMTVISASAAVRGLMLIMQEVSGHKTFSDLLIIPVSLLFAALLLVSIYLSITVVVTGNWFFRLVGDFLGLSDLVERFGTWQWVKYILLLAIVFLFIFLLYRFVTPLRKPRPPVMIGALLASVVLAAASAIFAAFMSASPRYSLVYGSLASLMILLLWLYLCGNIIILGGVVNYVIYTRRKKRK